MNFNLKIGLIPGRRDLANARTRKGLFSYKYAVDVKNKAIIFIREHFTDEKTEFVDLEWLNDEGLLFADSDCDKVRDRFLEEKVDAIFIINCNFGAEETAGQIAKMMKLPVLLWGPQDEPFDPDGMRHTDIQCGLFAISKQLQRLHVPFTYIENCPIDAPEFSKGVEDFLSVVSMVRNFKDLRITQVGTRLTPFKSVMSNELELTEKFGINLNTVNMSVVNVKMNKILDTRMDDLKADVERLRKMYDNIDETEENLIKVMAMVYLYKEIFEESRADVLTTECWTAFPPLFGVSPCLAISLLGDMGYIVTCESDVHGAVTQALLYAASRGAVPPLFGEFTCRNPQDKNSELLWHCGPFPYSSRKSGKNPDIVTGKPNFTVEDGRYTLSRFQGSEGKYTLLGGEFDTTEGPKTSGTYIWAKFDNLSAIEKKLINGPYIHHMSELRGSYGAVLEEFCKYIPGLEFDPLYK